MKQNWKPLACLLLALALSEIALAQSNLILPQSQDDIRQLTKSENTGPCIKCGIVTNVRSESRDRNPNQVSSPPSPSGVGSNITTTPIIGSGNAVKNAREAAKPTTYYKVTVRYDDGKYAVFEQEEEPELKKGDMVEAVDGRLQLRFD